MDLLLLNDKVGGSVKEGGFRQPRFVKPGRRLRGVEASEEELPDHFFSTMGSRMLMGAPGDSRRRPINKTITGTSDSQNSLFVLGAARGSPSAPESPIGPVLASPRSLYSARVRRELTTIAGRAGVSHLAAGGVGVLIECTPRSARFKIIPLIIYIFKKL